MGADETPREKVLTAQRAVLCELVRLLVTESEWLQTHEGKLPPGMVPVRGMAMKTLLEVERHGG